MAEREAKIAIMVKNGKIVVRTQIKSLSQPEIALLIVSVSILHDDLKELFKRGIKKIEE